MQRLSDVRQDHETSDIAHALQTQMQHQSMVHLPAYFVLSLSMAALKVDTLLLRFIPVSACLTQLPLQVTFLQSPLHGTKIQLCSIRLFRHSQVRMQEQ